MTSFSELTFWLIILTLVLGSIWGGVLVTALHVRSIREDRSSRRH